MSVADLRKALTETALPAALAETTAAIHTHLPPRPEMPDGVPKDFQEALFTPGICAIPLWSGKWRFAAICDGMPIEDTRTGGIVMFDSYAEAIEQLRGYIEWKKSNEHTP